MTSSIATVGTPPRAGLHRLFWRLHFWAGLITAPIVVFAAGTGLLYVFTPQIEGRVHADLDRVVIGPAHAPLDAQIAAARAVMSGQAPCSIVPGHEPGDTTQVLFAAATLHAQHAPLHDHGLPQGRIVYVNPYTAQVVGQIDEMQRFKTWARKLHSSALQGNGWRWMLELAASWMLVMAATGVALWWPTRGRRSGWRRVHSTVGLSAMGLLAIVLVTGLTWSRYAGDNFRWAQEAMGQSSPKPPKGLRSTLADGQGALRAQTIYETARAGLPDAALQLAPPRQSGDAWRIDTVVRDDPRVRRTLLLDAASGRELYRSGWDELPLLARATALGIPFHRAEFGVWNQIVLALTALAAMFSVLSGLVMWWRRRPRGQGRRLAAPTLPARPLRAVPPWLAALCLLMALALPVFGLSLALFIAAEIAAVAWRRGRLAHV